MKKMLVEIFGSGPWQYDSRAGRVMIWAIILVNLIAWPVLLWNLTILAKAVLG